MYRLFKNLNIKVKIKVKNNNIMLNNIIYLNSIYQHM